MPKDRAERLLTIFAVFCLALGIRLIGLGDSLFLDYPEMFSLNAWANNPDPLSISFITQGALSPFYPLVELWKLAFGDALWVLRLLPAFISALGAVFLFLIVERKITRITALFAAVFYAMNTLLIAGGQLLSPVPLAMLFILISVWYATKWLGCHGEQGKFATMVFALLAVYTHPVGFLYLVFLAFAALATRLEPGFKRRYSYLPVFAAFALALPAGVNFFVRIDSGSIFFENWPPSYQQYLLFPFGPNAITGFFMNIPFFGGVFHFMNFSPYITQSPFADVLQYVFAAGTVLFTLWLFFLGAWGGVKHPFMGFLFLIALIPSALLALSSPFGYAFIASFIPFGLACLAAGIGELSKEGRMGNAAAGLTAMVMLGFCLLAWNNNYYQVKQDMYAHQTRYHLRQQSAFRGDPVLVYDSQKTNAKKIDQILKANLVKAIPTKRAFADIESPTATQEILAMARAGRKIILLDRSSNKSDSRSRYSSFSARLAKEIGDPRVLEIEYPDRQGIYLFLIYPQVSNMNLYWYGSWPKSPHLSFLESIAQ